MTPEKGQEYRDEAERLAMLPVAERRKIIAMHRDIAAGEGVRTLHLLEKNVSWRAKYCFSYGFFRDFLLRKCHS